MRPGLPPSPPSKPPVDAPGEPMRVLHSSLGIHATSPAALLLSLPWCLPSNESLSATPTWMAEAAAAAGAKGKRIPPAIWSFQGAAIYRVFPSGLRPFWQPQHPPPHRRHPSQASGGSRTVREPFPEEGRWVQTGWNPRRSGYQGRLYTVSLSHVGDPS